MGTTNGDAMLLKDSPRMLVQEDLNKDDKPNLLD